MTYSEYEAIEQLVYKKILLYEDLLLCFVEERESLVNIDLDKLWLISNKKTEICSEIKELRREIVSIAGNVNEKGEFDLAEFAQMVPSERRSNFNKLVLRLMKVKAEIEAIRKENMSFLDDSLRFLDDIVSLIAGGARARSVYNDRCRFDRPSVNGILRQEV